MRVLQINSVCGIGSTGRIVTDIHNILIEQGHESFIAYGRDFPKDCETSIRIGNKYGNYLHFALTRLLDKHGFGSKKATQEFLKKIEKLDPDVIHLHNIHGYYINIEVLFNYLKRAGKPIIWTLHDCWAFTGHCAYFDYECCDKWKMECNNCPQKKTYPSSILVDGSKYNFLRKKEIFNGVENLKIITPSKWLAGLVKESFLSDYHIEVINNGIDLEIFKPTNNHFRHKFKLKDKCIILGIASTWDRRKGYKYFIELSNRLKQDEIVVLVGLNKNQIDELPPNIMGLNRTNNVKELADIYSASDVFINPTLEDNFPTTNLEAIACGTPVVTFNTGGSVESVNKECGYVVKKGDIDGLVRSVSLIKENGKQYYTPRCLEQAIKHYNKRQRFGDYIDLYNDFYKRNSAYTA